MRCRTPFYIDAQLFSIHRMHNILHVCSAYIYAPHTCNICSLYFLTEQQLQRVKIVGPIVSRYPARYPSWFPPPWCRLSFCEIKRNLCPLQVVNSHCIVSFSNALHCTYFLLRFRFNLTSFPLHLSWFFPTALVWIFSHCTCLDCIALANDWVAFQNSGLNELFLDSYKSEENVDLLVKSCANESEKS